MSIVLVPRVETTLRASSFARPLGPLLRGAPRPARVVGVYPAAAYLDVAGQLVALTARDAERLPFGVQVPVVARREQPLLGLAIGAAATVGGGAVSFAASVGGGGVSFAAPALRIGLDTATPW